MTRRLRGVLTAILLLVGTVGCASLPVSGAVHREAADQPGKQSDAPYFNPPGPAKDGSPAAIVSGFMVAMQANPLSTSVAREFLSEHARSTWNPNRGTIIYEAFTVQPTRRGADVRLADTRRLDARGGWRDVPPGSAESLDVALVSENGQWRIDNPPNALVVPTSYFQRSFSRFNLYFFDQTGTVLLPDPVFIPRGEQSASNLVRGLLAGPGAALADVTTSAIPTRTDLDLSVVVTESGVAEVPLSRELLQATPNELSHAVDQLAWTLRQVPGITRIRITVGGTPVPLPNGRTDASVSSGQQFDAATGGDEAVFYGLRSGRVVDLDSGDPVTGPLGRVGYSMRSLAVSEQPRRIAAVAGNGRAVFLAATGAGTDAAPVARVFTGTDVVRPSFDMLGNLWLLDRTPRGARVYVVRGTQAREVVIPGVTGAAVAAFSVARDGSRIAIGLAGASGPPIRIVDVLRTDDGIVSGPGQVRTVASGLSDASRIIDLGWRDPGVLAVLSRTTPETSQVGFVSSDGSPVPTTLVEPAVFRGVAASLAVAPDDVPLRLVTTDQRLYTLSSSGQWPRSSSRVSAAAYGQ